MPPKRAPEERFWEKVEKVPGGCWLWTAFLAANNYGRFNLTHGTPLYAHRVAYEWANGAIPEGMQLDHLCRVRNCVNPDHLEVVTQRVNILRGASPTAKNASKTQCAHGHPYDSRNTYWRPDGDGRACKACIHRRRTETQRKMVAL